MISRAIAGALVLVAVSSARGWAEDQDAAPLTPTLRAEVQVNSDIVTVGDLVDNAGPLAKVAVFRSPDLGTTGAVPVAQVLKVLRAHDVIGVDTRNLHDVMVTRAARTIATSEIGTEIAKALSGRSVLGDAADILVTLDRDVGPVQLAASDRGDLTPIVVRYDSHSRRFDVTFEIADEETGAPTRLRFTGIAYETVETTVLTRNVDRGDVLRTSDVAVERRPKTEVGSDLAIRGQALGMQMRRPLGSGQILHAADLGKPDIVQRDQNVSIIYQTPGLYLTMRGKATDNGAAGDRVGVINLESKRVVQGVVSGPGQVLVAPITPAITSTASAEAPQSDPQSASNE